MATQPATAPTSSTRSTNTEPSSQQQKNELVQQDSEYPSEKKALVIMIAVLLAALLVALDRTIVATATPVITNQFNSLGDVGWYGSAYLLTMSSLQMIIGRIYTFFNIKYVFLCCIALFEVGSLVCATSPNSTAFIVGRAIAGMGAAGLMSGGITIVVHILPLSKRPVYMSAFGSIFGIASVAGPLLGGAFTSNVSWRWCFYINLPIGGLAMAVILLIFKLPKGHKVENLTWRERFVRLDPIGNLFLIPAVVCLLLALQWGGTTYAWSEWRVILLLVLFPVLLAGFVIVQIALPKTATIPSHVIRNRSVIAATYYIFVAGAAMVVLVYFIPIWFQAISGVSAVESGIRNIPLILAMTIAAIIAGLLTKKIGYYAPWMFIAAVLMPIGAGLISTFTVDTPRSKWIGYQVIYGLGMGLGMQQPSIAVQTVLQRRDVPTGASLVFLFQGMGGALFLSVANNIFDNKLKQGLQGIPSINAETVTTVGATDLRNIVPSELLNQVLDVYNGAIVQAFYVAVGVSAAAILGAVAVEWKNVKVEEKKKKSEKNADTREEEKGGSDTV